MKTAATLTGVGLLVMALVLGSLVQLDSDAWVQDKLNTDSGSVEIIFDQDGGEDDSTTISLPMDSPVYNARLGIKGSADDTGSYPTAPWIDLQRLLRMWVR